MYHWHTTKVINNTGEQNKKEDAVWNISPDSTLLGVTDA